VFLWSPAPSPSDPLTPANESDPTVPTTPKGQALPLARANDVSSNEIVLGRESDNSISKLSEEDYRDYEFIVSDLEHNLALSPEQQLDRFRADPWNAFSGLKGPNGYDLPLSREALKRFECIATRGLKALGVATGLAPIVDTTS
jgi:hypothetical protein